VKPPNPPQLKDFLQDICLPSLSQEAPYFSISDIQRFLDARAVPFKERTLVRYLHDFVESSLIHDAGRAWYSSLETPFELDALSVQELVDEVEKSFPLVNFSCWSTAEIQGAMHHLLGKFVSFVMVESDAMESVHEHLRDAGWDGHLNPRGNEAVRFDPRERSVVIRRASSKSRVNRHIAPIEHLLVELYFEARDLDLMAADDYHTMLANLAGTSRINMAMLLSYATERKLEHGALFGTVNQLIPPIHFRRN
jgi:hypothetical protein